ncbi:MAG: hypothetical protein ACODAQ_04500 [Phycisphaeraceae bacterium]
MSQTLRRLSRVLTPLAPALTLLVLSVLAVRQWTESPRPAVDRPVAALRLSEHLPSAVGPWISERWEPPAAVPAAVRSAPRPRGRVYENVDTGRRVAVLVVEARDWRELRGYSPPQWYPSRGWRILAQRPVEWSVAASAVPAMEYDLAALGSVSSLGVRLGEADTQLTATSFAVLPMGRLAARLTDAGAVGPALEPAGAGGRARRAGLVQVMFAGDTPHRERQSAINSLMRAAILSIQQEKSAGDQS